MLFKLALVGFGNTGRAFARLLLTKRRELLSRYALSFQVTGIATASHGYAIDAKGINLERALKRVEMRKGLGGLNRGLPVRDTRDFIRRRPAQILFELTPLNPWTGIPAVDYVRAALDRGMHVVTANKGPVAVAYPELRDLARAKGRAFRFEGTVLDGAPVFNLVEKTLPATEIIGFHGIVNSTCNFILSEMEKGRSFKAALSRARKLGITEADPSYDIEGWDAAAKTAVLANVLLGSPLRASDVSRMGIGAVDTAILEDARRRGKSMRLIARAARRGHRVTARVAPELLDVSDPMAHVVGTSNALTIETDTMKRLTLIEERPGIEQTAYALLSDFLTIAVPNN